MALLLTDWYTRIKYYYDKGYYDNADLVTFVNAGYITMAQYYSISGDKEQLKIWVVEGKLTPEEYLVITGEEYVVG